MVIYRYNCSSFFVICTYIGSEILRNFSKTTLPTNGDVLRRLTYSRLVDRLTINDSIDIVVDEIISVWQKLSILTKRKDHVKTAVRKLHDHYTLVKKNKARRTSAQIQKESNLLEQFPVLFDIAHEGIFIYLNLLPLYFF